MRQALGPTDALERCADYAVELARAIGMIRIYHTSDLHNRRGIAAPLRRMRAQHPGLLFDCGDALRGSQTVYYRNEPIIAEMDAAGYDAQAIGNREFHYLFSLLQGRVRRYAPSVGLHEFARHEVSPLPFLPMLRLQLRDDEGQAVRVHVCGLLIMQYPVGSMWERVFGWRFLNPWDAVAPYARPFRRAICSWCSRTLGSRSTASWRERCRESTRFWAVIVTTRWSARNTWAECRSSTPDHTGDSFHAAGSSASRREPISANRIRSRSAFTAEFAMRRFSS